MTLFDDDGFGIDEFASALLAGEIIAEHERPKQMTEEPEPLVPDDNKEQWERE